jgi:hypothetical protein
MVFDQDDGQTVSSDCSTPEGLHHYFRGTYTKPDRIDGTFTRVDPQGCKMSVPGYFTVSGDCATTAGLHHIFHGTYTATDTITGTITRVDASGCKMTSPATFHIDDQETVDYTVAPFTGCGLNRVGAANRVEIKRQGWENRPMQLPVHQREQLGATLAHAFGETGRHDITLPPGAAPEFGSLPADLRAVLQPAAPLFPEHAHLPCDSKVKVADSEVLEVSKLAFRAQDNKRGVCWAQRSAELGFARAAVILGVAVRAAAQRRYRDLLRRRGRSG